MSCGTECVFRNMVDEGSEKCYDNFAHITQKRKSMYMKAKKNKRIFLFLTALLTVFAVSCAAPGGEKSNEGGNFAKAHDAFQTKLTSQSNDEYEIPAPPEGVFDLVYYPSKVGDLAAYVSSDPGDGEKHPLIIWVVGGWGNGIDDFPWVYPEWDNDQTGSAFSQAGILTMYPSFRGANGNPGYYETLFGEVDDIVSAYEYAASLPYVDPDRIYLGGHSTGGTRALLAAEYTDKFRAVFCFGAVDEIKYHNRSQFTFDTSDEEEFRMRSPIHWLDDVKSPTFLIEGSGGNSANLRNIKKASKNDNIHCYIVEDADHFSVLGPITPLIAQKIVADTGKKPNISITDKELASAMKQNPPVPMPVMTERTLDGLGFTLSCPYIWDIIKSDTAIVAYSRYDDDNAWDMSALYFSSYTATEEEGNLQDLIQMMRAEGFTVQETVIGGLPAMDSYGMVQEDSENMYYERYIVIQNGDTYTGFDFYVHSVYVNEAVPLFQAIVDSIRPIQ